MNKHFHILWKTDKDTRFDVTACATEDEANQLATSIVMPGETWDIVEVEGNCSMDCLAWLTRRKILRGHERNNT